MLRLPRRRALSSLAAWIPAVSHAAAPPGDIGRFVLVPSAERPVASLVDGDANRIQAEVPLGLVPRQAVVSRTEACLVVSDGTSPAFTVIDLATLSSTKVALGHRAERLTLGAAGWLLAVADAAGGAITVFDLRRHAVMARMAGLPRLRDVMFVDNDGYLLVAAESWPHAALIDVNTSEIVRRIVPLGAGPGGIAAFTRTPNGHSVLIRQEGRAPLGILDVESKEITGTFRDEAAAEGVVPSGTGALLFVPDSRDARLRIYRTGQTAAAASLPAAPGLAAVYSAWLDSVGFLAVPARRQLLLYDLDRLRPAGRLDLPGTPGPGGVSADSGKLFLPLTAPAGLAVIDARTRELAALLPLSSAPLAAVVPGGWGLCH